MVSSEPEVEQKEEEEPAEGGDREAESSSSEEGEQLEQTADQEDITIQSVITHINTANLVGGPIVRPPALPFMMPPTVAFPANMQSQPFCPQVPRHPYAMPQFGGLAPHMISYSTMPQAPFQPWWMVPNSMGFPAVAPQAFPNTAMAMNPTANLPFPGMMPHMFNPGMIPRPHSMYLPQALPSTVSQNVPNPGQSYTMQFQ